MRSFERLGWVVIATMVLVVAAASSPGRALAFDDDECGASCHDASKTCARAAKAAFGGCKEECRSAESRRDCRKACRASLTDARDVCLATRQGCHEVCEEKPEPPAGCSHCVPELRACLVRVSHEGRACTSECLAGRRDDGRECRHEHDPIGCLHGVAHGASGCLSDCAHGMRTGAQECRVSHLACVDACQGGGAYGSPSHAFLRPSCTLLE